MRHTRTAMATLGVAALLATTTQAVAAGAAPLGWINQFGTTTNDAASNSVVDSSGNVYLVGWTFGDLGPNPHGSEDAFVAKLDKNGNRIWTVLLGGELDDRGADITFGPGGDLYVTGTVPDTVDIATAKGLSDAFVARVSTKGVVKWLHQYGTSAVETGDRIVGNSSAVYLVGETSGTLEGEAPLKGAWDNFVMKLDKNGKISWTTQFGTDGAEEPSGLAVTKTGLVLVTGQTDKHFADNSAAEGGSLGFVVQFDKNGNQGWVREFDSSAADYAAGVAVTSAGDYRVAGFTDGQLGLALPKGTDVFVSALSKDGTLAWTNQFGTDENDSVLDVAVGSDSSTYVVGPTVGGFAGFANQGSTDSYVARVSKFGDTVAVRQFGTPAVETLSGISLRKTAPNVVVVGNTTAALFGFGGDGASDVLALAFPF